MRRIPPALLFLAPLLALATAPPSLAQRAAAPAAGPQRIGTFGNWTAATHTENGGKICYAFTRAQRSEGGGNRQNVLLTVTHRPQGRDQVSVALGYALPRGGENNVSAAVGDRELPFYGAGTNAFAQNNANAVAAFRNGRDAVVKGPGNGGRGTTTDTFSLSGFSAAHEAISRECPARR